jgi:hypothetical protein
VETNGYLSAEILYPPISKSLTKVEPSGYVGLQMFLSCCLKKSHGYDFYPLVSRGLTKMETSGYVGLEMFCLLISRSPTKMETSG